jgi:hypothetical protein
VVEEFIRRGLERREADNRSKAHTHTLTSTSQTATPSSKKDDILLLKGKIIEQLGLGTEMSYPPLPRRKILDAIKEVEDVMDDRSANARLGRLIAHGLCVELDRVKGMVRPIKFKSAFDDMEAVAISEQEIKRKEAEDIFSRYNN